MISKVFFACDLLPAPGVAILGRKQRPKEDLRSDELKAKFERSRLGPMKLYQLNKQAYQGK